MIVSALNHHDSSRVAVVLSHPIQYYSPWFRDLAASHGIELRVFYLWDSGTTAKTDRGFGTEFAWDIPLLEGYESKMIPNAAFDPGTHHFNGLDNPSLINELANWKPDAILLFGYAWKSHLRVILSPRLRKIPLLFRGDSHNLYSSPGLKAGVARRLKSVLFRRFSVFLSVGKANRDFLTYHGVLDEKIVHCPHCVDNERFRSSEASALVEAKAWKQELGISPDRPVALFAGKFESKKRPLDLLEAFRSYLAMGNKEGRDSPDRPALLFVGNGHLESQLREQSGEQLDETVFFSPFQNQSEMPKVYAAGNFLVLPSFGRGETWGLVVNEAMNLGVPAIVSSHVGCGPDLVVEGETGWQFSAGNVDELTGCLRAAFASIDGTRKRGHNAKEKIADWSYEAATAALSAALPSTARSL